MNRTAPAIVVMGVAGCGKSSVARAMAERLDARFIEGDAFHSAANVEKMRRGIGLVDADRLPWLDRLAAELKDAYERGERVVLACSALKRRYRDRLRQGSASISFVFLNLPAHEAAKRVSGRNGHFMPDSLVASQFADLEAPVAETLTLTVDATQPVDMIVDQTLDWHALTLPQAQRLSLGADSAVSSASLRRGNSSIQEANSHS